MTDLIDTKKLRMFAETLREGSMRKASQKLFVTPSALSHGIKSLEDSLGIQLLERDGPKIRPTPDGSRFFNEASDILGRLDEIELRYSGSIGPLSKELYIGLTNIGCQYLLPAIVREFRESWPDISLKLEVGDTDFLLDRLNDHRIDLAIAPIQRDYEGIVQTEIATDELVYIVHPSHPWVKKEQIDRSSLAEQRLIIPAVSSNTYNLIDARYREIRLPLKPFIELNNDDTIRQLVMLNMGTGVVPRWVVTQEIERGLLHAFPFYRKPLKRRWTVSHHTKFPNNLMEFVFIGTTKAVAQNLIHL